LGEEERKEEDVKKEDVEEKERQEEDGKGEGEGGGGGGGGGGRRYVVSGERIGKSYNATMERSKLRRNRYYHDVICMYYMRRIFIAAK
jgi:hypothetical protein